MVTLITLDTLNDPTNVQVSNKHSEEKRSSKAMNLEIEFERNTLELLWGYLDFFHHIFAFNDGIVYVYTHVSYNIYIHIHDDDDVSWSSGG